MSNEQCFYCGEYHPKEELVSFTGFSLQHGYFEPILTCLECKGSKDHQDNVESTNRELDLEAELNAPYDEDEED